MIRIVHLLTMTGFLWTQSTVNGSTNDGPASLLTVNVEKVSEVRDLDGPQAGVSRARHFLASTPRSTRIDVRFEGAALEGVMGIRAVHLTKAEDENGASLLLSDTMDEPPPAVSRHYRLGHDFALVYSVSYPNSGVRHGAYKTIQLKQTRRSAQHIRVIEGEVECFRPDATNGGTFIVTGSLDRVGDVFSAPALVDRKIEFMYLGRENFRARSVFNNPRYAGITNLPTDIKDSLHFSIKDPSNQILGVEFQSDSGKSIPSIGQTSTGTYSYIYQFASPPPLETKVVIYLATTNAISRLPFRLENIRLP